MPLNSVLKVATFCWILNGKAVVSYSYTASVRAHGKVRHRGYSPRQYHTLSSAPQPIDGKSWPTKFPAKEFCSCCGLCETTFVSRVTDACAFLPNLGMAKMDQLEVAVHGRHRNIDDMVWSKGSKHNHTIATLSTHKVTTTNNTAEEARFGVLHEPVLLARGIGMAGAQWTGVVTSIAVSMLESGRVDAVACVAAGSSSWCDPEPILARNVSDVLRGRGVKPALAPSLRVLDQIRRDPTIKGLLFCGVGCAVQAFRAVQEDLMKSGVEEIYVLGTNCVDNSPTADAAATFLRDGLQISKDANVLGYEFMPDYRVHVKTAQKYIRKPYFSLPARIAEPSIAKSCLSCFDYTNSLADVVVGYMGAPPATTAGQRMNQCVQTLTIRNGLGSIMVQTATDAGRIRIEGKAFGSGQHEALACTTLRSDAHVQSMIGRQLPEHGLPVWIGEILAFSLRSFGPKGVSFARYSIDYHILRNYLCVLSQTTTIKSDFGVTALPFFAQRVVEHYRSTDREFQRLESIISKKQDTT